MLQRLMLEDVFFTMRCFIVSERFMYSKSRSMPSIDGSTPPGGLSVLAGESANQSETSVWQGMLGIHQKNKKHVHSQAVGKVAMDQSLS